MIRKLTLALAVLVPLFALAASPTEPDAAAPAAPSASPADAGGTPADEELPVAPIEGGAGAGEKTAVAPPDTYTVRPGDTLWDLSGRFLNSPWYWPKIWAYNPDIANPHWIFPGNALRLYPSADEGALAVVPARSEEPIMEEEEAQPVKELEDLSRADLTAPPSEEEKEVVSVGGAHPIGWTRASSGATRRDAFVTRLELEESGTIRASFEEKAMLAALDPAYVHFESPQAVKVGQTYAIYRTLREVKHPVTGEVLGFQSTILGAAKVVALNKDVATVSITASYDSIERGDRLGPWVDDIYKAVLPRPNAKAVRGYVVSSPIEILTTLAQSQVVFVDKGKAEGVEEGNRFTVLRTGDPLVSPTEARALDALLPAEDIGTLLVVDVKEHTSSALVTRSLRELHPGDRVEMRVAEK